MITIVVFAMSARTKLAQRSARGLATNSKALKMNISNLERRLMMVFPNDSVVVVQDLYEGFRRRDDEYVVLVEVTRNGIPDGPAVVKLGPPERLQVELDCWESCRPQGLKHDLVLMDLEAKRDEQGQLIALVYVDAQQLIGVDQTMTLEAAMLDAIRFGEPMIESVADLLFHLYERLGLLLYRHSFDDDPKDWGKGVSLQYLDKHLDRNLQAWSLEPSQAFTIRAGVTTELDRSSLKENFRDPAFMFCHIASHPNPREFIPRTLRGRAHGDLHGRNVLVGKVRNRILWPAVYDFGDMGPNNLIGWDFVKLETETKIRAFPSLFASSRFAEQVVQFEVQLFEATEKARESDDWPALQANPSPVDRLHWLLLQLRRLASEHMGQSGRSRLWLMEYYFLLVVYGLNSVRFENLSHIEQKGAYLSAGSAAARYLPLV